MIASARRPKRWIELLVLISLLVPLRGYSQDEEDPAPSLPESTIPEADPAESQAAPEPEATESAPAEPDSTPAPEEESAQPESEPAQDEDEPKPEAKVEPEKSPAAASEPASSAEETIAPRQSMEVGQKTHATGRYKIHIGAAKPKFTDKFVDHDKFYGKSSVYPVGAVDYLFFDWYATLGVHMGLGYYRDTDKATSADESDTNPSATELVAIPIQASVVAQIVPSRSSFLSLSVWTGMEAVYAQETIQPKGAKAEEDSSSKVSTSVYSGWNSARVVGAGLGIRLDPLDRGAVGSLEFMGIGSVYIMPFAENVQTVKKKMMDLSRTSVGVLFSFETLK
ncbi:MAG: hypothetical protein AB7T49_14810 [Oligoflexales bacterium]